MKQFKGYTEGTQFRGDLKFIDVMEMQNKAISAIEVTDSIISIYSGINIAVTDSGMDITDGILLWGGFPATFEGKSNVPITGKKYFTITVTPQDERNSEFEGNVYSYFAYDYYQAEITEEFYAIGSSFQEKEVVACVPFFFRVNDYPTALIQNNTIEGGEGDIVSYNSSKAIVYLAGDDKYLLLKGVVFGDQETADLLGGVLIGNLVQFGDNLSVQTAAITLEQFTERNPIPLSGLLVDILSQMRKNINDVKKVAYTSDYDDLENKLTMANDLLLNLNDVIFTKVPLNGSVRTIISLLVSAVNQLKQVALSGRYQDLSNAPYKLSDITNDLIIPDEEPIGAIKMMSSNEPIPPGWQIADGTNGTLDLTGFGPTVSTWTDFITSEGEQFITSDSEVFQVKTAALMNIQKVSEGKALLSMSVEGGLGTVGLTPLCGNTILSIKRVIGDSVELYALPNGSNKFDCWNKGLPTENSQNPLSLNLDENVSYKAYFLRYYGIIVNVEGPNTVGAVSTSLDQEWKQSLQVDVEKSVKVYAQVADEGYVFNGFYSNGAKLESTLVDGKWELNLQAIDSDMLISASYSVRPTIIIDINPNLAGQYSISPEGPYSVGQEIRIQANPDGINKFINFSWKEFGIEKESTQNPLVYTVLDGENDINVNFQEVYKQTIRTEDSTTKRGTISVDGSEFTTKVIKNVDKSDLVTIEAKPSAGWAFSQWASTTKNPLGFESKMSYKVEATEEVIAKFVRVYNLLTLESQPSDKGSVTGAGNYEYGTVANIRAIPVTGYQFKEWLIVKGDKTEHLSYEAQTEYTVIEPTYLIATFEKIQNQVEISIVPQGTGTVTGSGTYNYGDTVSVEALPATYYEFDGWYENGIKVSNQIKYTFVIQKNWSFEARFKKIQKTINLSVSPNNSGTVTGSGQFDQGVLRTIVASPIEGYRFIGWYEGTSLVSKEPNYSFILIRDVDFIAKFEVIEVELKLSVNDELRGSVVGGGNYIYGQTVTIVATPRAGYAFKQWRILSTGEILSTDRTYLFKLQTSMEIQAEFVPVQYQITVNPSNTAYGSVTGSGMYDFNSIATVRAVPKEGYIFNGWYEGEVKVSDSAMYQFTVNGNRNLVARFVQQ